MTPVFRTALCLLPILGAPALSTAQAEERCPHTGTRELALDLEGVRTIRLEVAQHRIRINGAPTPDPVLRGRACASTPSMLESLVLEQSRDGDTLTVTLRRAATATGWMGNQYARLDVTGQVPDDVLVQTVVGSGDAVVSDVAAASADVGSGDVVLRRVGGQVTAKVGSGDLDIAGAGALKVLSIGSGDVVAHDIRGAVEVASVRSGDFRLEDGAGDVRIGRLGSGDIELLRVDGNVQVDSIGSGDLDVESVTGNLVVDTKGSGDIEHNDVHGTVTLPSRH